MSSISNLLEKAAIAHVKPMLVTEANKLEQSLGDAIVAKLKAVGIAIPAEEEASIIETINDETDAFIDKL